MSLSIVKISFKIHLCCYKWQDFLLSFGWIMVHCVYICMYVCIYMKVKSVSRSVMSDSATPWTVACQAPLSMGFSRQEYWSGQSFPSLGDLPDPGFESRSAALQVVAGSQHMRSHPWQGHEEKTWQARRIRFSGIPKSCPSVHLKDDICLSDACFNRLVPNFCDTGRRPSPISFQIRISLEL